MPDFDPVRIFFYIIKVAPVVMLVLFFSIMFSFLPDTQRSNEMERFAAGVADSLMNSDLTYARYVFDADKLDELLQANGDGTIHELPNARSCRFGYYAEIEDVVTDKKWSFGYRTGSSIIGNRIDSVTRTFDTSVIVKSSNGENFYESVNQARLAVVAYDSRFVRAACAVETAFRTREIQEIECFDDDPCFSLRRKENEVCFFFRTTSGSEVERECRYMPPDIEFTDGFYKSVSEIFAEGLKPKDMVVRFYPIKFGENPECSQVIGNHEAFLPPEGEETNIVLICAEEKENG